MWGWDQRGPSLLLVTIFALFWCFFFRGFSGFSHFSKPNTSRLQVDLDIIVVQWSELPSSRTRCHIRVEFVVDFHLVLIVFLGSPAFISFLLKNQFFLPDSKSISFIHKKRPWSQTFVTSRKINSVCFRWDKYMSFRAKITSASIVGKQVDGS